jgi:hypothetical protein
MSYKMFDNFSPVLYNTHMKTKTSTITEDSTKRISIREYIRNYKKYNNEIKLTGKNIIVTNQGGDEITLSPVPKIKTLRKWTIKDFEKGFFKGPKNLSQNVDEIVYGI